MTPGYEVPIPWKTNDPQLRSNKTIALRRLIGLMKKFAREPEYQVEYQKSGEEIPGRRIRSKGN